MGVKIGSIFLRHCKGKTLGWYVKVGDKQIRVAMPDESREQADAGLERYLEVNGLRNGVLMDYKTCRWLTDTYISAINILVKPHTLANKRRIYKTFNDKFGDVIYADLNWAVVKDWIEQFPTWTQGGKRQVAQNLKACFQWFFDRERLKENRLSRLKIKESPPRPVQFALSPEHYAKILQGSPDWLKPILEMLWLTGARPSEILTATVQEYNRLSRRLDKLDHKTRHKGCYRHIGLCDRAMSIMDEMVELHPEGRLFVGRDGGNPTPSYIDERLKEIALEVGIPAEQVKFISCYSFRHGFATQAVLAGVPLPKIASRLGHSNTKLVERVYGHVRDLADHDQEDLRILEEYRNRQAK